VYFNRQKRKKKQPVKQPDKKKMKKKHTADPGGPGIPLSPLI